MLLDFPNWAIFSIWVMLIIIGFSSGTVSECCCIPVMQGSPAIISTSFFLQNMNVLTNNKTGSEGLMNHLSLLHQPLSLCGIQHVCFHQKALFKGVLINLPGREGTQVSVAHFHYSFNCINMEIKLPRLGKKKRKKFQMWQKSFDASMRLFVKLINTKLQFTAKVSWKLLSF